MKRPTKPSTPALNHLVVDAFHHLTERGSTVQVDKWAVHDAMVDPDHDHGAVITLTHGQGDDSTVERYTVMFARHVETKEVDSREAGRRIAEFLAAEAADGYAWFPSDVADELGLDTIHANQIMDEFRLARQQLPAATVDHDTLIVVDREFVNHPRLGEVEVRHLEDEQREVVEVRFEEFGGRWIVRRHPDTGPDLLHSEREDGVQLYYRTLAEVYAGVCPNVVDYEDKKPFGRETIVKEKAIEAPGAESLVKEKATGVEDLPAMIHDPGSLVNGKATGDETASTMIPDSIDVVKEKEHDASIHIGDNPDKGAVVNKKATTVSIETSARDLVRVFACVPPALCGLPFTAGDRDDPVNAAWLQLARASWDRMLRALDAGLSYQALGRALADKLSNALDIIAEEPGAMTRAGFQEAEQLVERWRVIDTGEGVMADVNRGKASNVEAAARRLIAELDTMTPSWRRAPLVGFSFHAGGPVNRAWTQLIQALEG